MARPRQHDFDDRLLAAWGELTAEQPYGRITMSAVAERAGVGKPALYRRFPTKAHVAFAAGVATSTPAEAPDLGSIEADLTAVVGELARSLRDVPREVYADQIGRAIADAEFADRVHQEYTRANLAQVEGLWQRGVARGEIDPVLDATTALNDLAGSIIFTILVRHGAGDERYLAAAVRRFVRGIAP